MSEKAVQNKPKVVVTQRTAVSEAAKRQAYKTKKKEQRWEFPYNRQNFIIAGVGVLVIIVGYLLMSTGITEEPAVLDGKWNNPLAITVAPLLLILGYCVIIPYALYRFFGKKEEPEA